VAVTIRLADEEHGDTGRGKTNGGRAFSDPRREKQFAPLPGKRGYNVSGVSMHIPSLHFTQGMTAMTHLGRIALLALACLGVISSGVFADPPRVVEWKTQKVGDTTYFTVRFSKPADLALPDIQGSYFFTGADLARLPRLLPLDKGARDVTLSFARNSGWYPETDRPYVPHLQFRGKIKNRARFLLIYPTHPDGNKAGEEGKPTSLEGILQERNSWKEIEVALIVTPESVVKEVPGGGARKNDAIPVEDDLEGRWAVDRAYYYALLERETPEFGYYSLARELIGRRYNVPTNPVRQFRGGPDRSHLRLYDITTGTTAIAETLALDRMRNPAKNADPEARTLDVATLPAIDIKEHDWVTMMGDKKPAPEHLAGFVPHDNYYLHFKHFGKFLELMDLANELGATIGRSLSVQSKEAYFKERIERQLCLKSTGLGKLLGPALIKSLAVTGSDPYVREGSDLTFLFQTTNKTLFLAGLEPHLKEARASWGKDLKEARSEHAGLKIESFVTPLREVSLHRAVMDDVVIYSNSPVGIRRVIDAAMGKIKPCTTRERGNSQGYILDALPFDHG